MEDIKRPDISTPPVKDRASVWIKERLASITLFVTAIAFIFREALLFSRDDKDLLTFIMSFSFTYLFAVYTSLMLRKIGKNNAKESKQFQAAKKYMADAKSKISETSYLMPVFCDIKNERRLADIRHRYIEENGLNVILAKSGYYDTEEGFSELDEEAKRIYEESKKIKIQPLTPSDVLSERSTRNQGDPEALGRTESQLDKTAVTSILITKSLFPIITTYFGVQVVLGTNLIWGVIQTSIIMLMGAWHYMLGEEEVKTILRDRYITKGDYIIEFMSLLKARPDLFEQEMQKITKIDKMSQS